MCASPSFHGASSRAYSSSNLQEAVGLGLSPPVTPRSLGASRPQKTFGLGLSPPMTPRSLGASKPPKTFDQLNWAEISEILIQEIKHRKGSCIRQGFVQYKSGEIERCTFLKDDIGKMIEHVKKSKHERGGEAKEVRGHPQDIELLELRTEDHNTFICELLIVPSENCFTNVSQQPMSIDKVNQLVAGTKSFMVHKGTPLDQKETAAHKEAAVHEAYTCWAESKERENIFVPCQISQGQLAAIISALQAKHIPLQVYLTKKGAEVVLDDIFHDSPVGTRSNSPSFNELPGAFLGHQRAVSETIQREVIHSSRATPPRHPTTRSLHINSRGSSPGGSPALSPMAARRLFAGGDLSIPVYGQFVNGQLGEQVASGSSSRAASPQVSAALDKMQQAEALRASN